MTIVAKLYSMRTMGLKKLQIFLLLLLFIVIPMTVLAVTHMKFKVSPVSSVLSVASQGARDDSVLTVIPSPIKTVFVVVMENQNWSTIKTSPSASYIRNF